MPTSEGQSKGGKNRWAKWSKKQRAEHMAKMRSSVKNRHPLPPLTTEQARRAAKIRWEKYHEKAKESSQPSPSDMED